MIYSCAFTGHRNIPSDFSLKPLKEAILKVLKEGCRVFYCGMAYGFDLIACSTLLEFKNLYDFKIVACIPCADQAKDFSISDKKLYARMLSACDEKVVLHKTFVKGCMFERDRYMVDKSSALIAYLVERESGTGYTVRYAEEKGLKIIYV